jgi:septal ring factor EnvC (AmiA/AmiB activator)
MKTVKILILGFFVLSFSGCATIEKAKKVDKLEGEVGQLSQALKDKDAQIAQLQEMLDGQQKEMQENEILHQNSLDKLYKQMNELKMRQKSLEKKEPNLK